MQPSDIIVRASLFLGASELPTVGVRVLDTKRDHAIHKGCTTRYLSESSTLL